MAAGSKLSRSTPRLGLAFLISAITAGRPAASRARSAPTKSRGGAALRAAFSRAGCGRAFLARASSPALAARMRCRTSAIGPGEADEGVELLARRAAGDHRLGLLHAGDHGRRQPRDVDGGAGIQRDD